MGNAPVCVTCRREPVDPRFRPFCSDRCRMVDLGRWLGEAYRVPSAEPAPDPDPPSHGRDADDH